MFEVEDHKRVLLEQLNTLGKRVCAVELLVVLHARRVKRFCRIDEFADDRDLDKLAVNRRLLANDATSGVFHLQRALLANSVEVPAHHARTAVFVGIHEI